MDERRLELTETDGAGNVIATYLSSPTDSGQICRIDIVVGDRPPRTFGPLPFSWPLISEGVGLIPVKRGQDIYEETELHSLLMGIG